MIDLWDSALGRALDRIAVALVVTTRDGRILYANAAAQAMVQGDTGDGISLICGSLHADGRDGGAGNRERSISTTLPLGVGRQPVLVFAVPLRPASGDPSGGDPSGGDPSGGDPSGGDEAAVVAVLVDPVPNAPHSRQEGETCLGLTPAEWNVARRLGNGSTLQEIARATGITRNTARSHLKSAFRKLGVHRQADLVRVITVATLLRGP